MAKRDKLLDLIHTLSMSEKRYFKIFSQRHVSDGSTQYERLFEVACELPQPDAKAFEAALAQAGLQRKFLAGDKNYLYQLLLRALTNFHAGRTVSMQVKEWLFQAEILFDKGLYDQCLSLTKSARQQAEHHDLYALLMEISLWERKVLQETKQISAIKESHSQVLTHLGLMDNMHAFMLLYYQLLELDQQLANDSPALRNERLHKFIQHPFLQSEHVALSFQARRHFWMIFALYHRLTQQALEELQACEQLIRLMDEHVLYLEERPYDYVEVYSRMLNLKLSLSSEDFQKSLEQFRHFPQRLRKAPRNVEAKVVMDAYLFEVPWLLQHKEFDTASKSLAGLRKQFAVYEGQVTRPQFLEETFWQSRWWLETGDPAQCIQSLHRLLNECGAEDPLDLQIFGRILALMAHYERENYSILPYLADATLRLLTKQKERFVLEAWVIRRLKRLARVEFRDEQHARQVFQGIQDQWRAQLETAANSRLEAYLDLPAWVEQHL